MKKSRLLLAFILTLALLFALTAAANAASRIFGDVDGDDKVTASDARLALRAAVSLDDHLSDIAKQAANVDGDEKITASDARLILRAAVSLEELTGTIHVHEPAEAVRENEKAATCTEDGSYDTVVRCKDCSEELSRETVAVPATGHEITFSEAKSEFSLTGDNRLVFECSRCGLDGTTDPTLVHVVKLTSEATDDNMLIVNHFINRLKGDLKGVPDEEGNILSGIKYISAESTVNSAKLKDSSFKTNKLMDWVLPTLNSMMDEPDSTIPTNKTEWDQELNKTIEDANKTQNITVWPVYLTNENFVLKNQPIVSALLATDLNKLTVTSISEYDIEGFLPDVLPETRTIVMKTDGSYWYAGTPNNYNLKTMFLARLQDSTKIIKITLELNDESYDNISSFADQTNLCRIIDFNKSDFEMDDISSAFADEEVSGISASQKNTIKTNCTVVYYFDAESQKPLAATYSTRVETDNYCGIDVSIGLAELIEMMSEKGVTVPAALRWLNIPATMNMSFSIDMNTQTKTIYIFDPITIY